MKKGIWLILVFIFCSASFPFREVPQPDQAEHLAVLFILDDSGSMFGNDQSNLRYSAAAMFISALDIGDWVGVVQFSDAAQALTPQMLQIEEAAQKEKLLELLTAPAADGYTNVLSAFQKGKEVLNNLPAAGIKPVVIFLTDGKPEVYQMPAHYLEDSLAAGAALNIPIYAVSLTSEGQSQFLTDLTTLTNGKIFNAKTSLDLLDRYLSILTDLKDRSILGTGQQAAPGEVSIDIEPALQPYINQFTIVVPVNGLVQSHLVSPDGREMRPTDAEVSFIFKKDGRFQVYNITDPVVGSWKLVLEGSGQAQVRTILHTRLRAKLEGLNPLSPQGEPLLISVHLEELMMDGSRQKIVGEAAFEGEITLPDASGISLDVFYDDGTHGDPLAADGNYSRVLTDTSQVGIYQIQIHGVKSGIPVEVREEIEVLPFPKFKLLSPETTLVSLKEEPLRVVIEQVDAQPDFVEGWLNLTVTDPNGGVIPVELEKEGRLYSGYFSPQISGIYQLKPDTADFTYLGQPVGSTDLWEITVQKQYEVSLMDYGFTYQRSVFTKAEVSQGLDVWMVVQSNSPHPESVSFELLGVGEMALTGENSFVLPSRQESAVQLTLQGRDAIEPGKFTGRIRMTAGEGINSRAFVVPLQWEIIQPTLDWEVQAVPVQPAQVCWLCPVGEVVLKINLSHFQSVPLDYQVFSSGGELAFSGTIQVNPGEQAVHIPLPEALLTAGDFEGVLVLVPADQSMTLSQKQEEIKVHIPSFLVRCKTPLIISGMGLFILGMMARKMISKRWQKNKPPMVKLDLIYWPLENPTLEMQLSFEKESVRIGSAAGNDLILDGDSVLAEHVLITALRNAEDGVDLYLEPAGVVQRGYRLLKGKTLLEEYVVYQIAEWGFKVIFDPTAN